MHDITGLVVINILRFVSQYFVISMAIQQNSNWYFYFSRYLTNTQCYLLIDAPFIALMQIVWTLQSRSVCSSHIINLTLIIVAQVNPWSWVIIVIKYNTLKCILVEYFTMWVMFLMYYVGNVLGYTKDNEINNIYFKNMLYISTYHPLPDE